MNGPSINRVAKEGCTKPDASPYPLFEVVLSRWPRIAAISPRWDMATGEISDGCSKLELMIVVADPQIRIADLHLLTLQEKRKVLVEWNDTGADFPVEARGHHLGDPT